MQSIRGRDDRAQTQYRLKPGPSACLALVAILAITAPASAQTPEEPLEATCKARDVERGIAACTQILDGSPIDALAESASFERGSKLQAKGEHAKAVADFTMALRLNPGNFRAYADRGTSYVRLEKFDQARPDFDEAIRLKPEFPEGYSGRSFLNVRQGMLDGAIADATEAIRLDPRQVVAYNNRGVALREKGMFDNALVDFNVAIRINAYFSRTLYNRGLTYFRQGNLQHALADYEAALVLAPRDPETLQGRNAARAALAARGEALPTPKPADTAPPAAPSGQPASSGAPEITQAKPGAVPAARPSETPQSTQPVVQASRPADAGNVWKPFEARSLGLRLLVQEAAKPAERYAFSEHGDWLEQHRVSDSTTFGDPHVIRVLHKPGNQSIEGAIAEAFVSSLKGEARTSCRVKPTDPSIELGVGKMTLEIAPVGRYAKKIDAELKQGPRDFGCGNYGRGQSSNYFEYHPQESLTTYLYVDTGVDPPLFDEKSIRIVPSAQSAAAEPGAPQSDVPSSVAAQIWSVALNRAPDGSKFCEATAKGRNSNLGDYSIRYRPAPGQPGRPAIVILTYASQRFKEARTAVIRMDGRMLLAIPVKQITLAGENALVAEIDGERFVDAVVTEFEKPGAVLVDIEVGGRTFEVPVGGYATVSANLATCRRDT